MKNYSRFIIFEGEKVLFRAYNLNKKPEFESEINDRQLLKLAMDCLIAYVRIITRKRNEKFGQTTD